MKAEYVSHMGDDLTVVNAARVSFNKKSDWVCSCGEKEAWVHDYDHEYYCGACNHGSEITLSEEDRGLVKYLAKHNHWTPFAHTSICLHLKMPLFVARQIDKHQVGFVVNEVSRRYVKYEPTFYEPVWRKAPEESVKQGSAEEFPEDKQHWINGGENWNDMALNYYQWLLDEGVCPEQARMVLPQSMYTEQWKTGSLVAWARLCNLRLDPHAQKETREIAQQIDAIIAPLFPVAWKSLVEKE